MRALLVANRGEIARRVFRTASSMGLGTVAVYTSFDADSPHVAEADVAVLVPSYLDRDAVIAAARSAGADAVHPGYGFLAEDAAFASAVTEAGLTWVGPPAPAIAAMGSKVEARARMQAAGVPVVPSGEDAGFPVMVKASAGGGGKGMRIVRSADELEDAMAAARREALAAFGDDTVFLERYVENPRHVEIQVFADASGRAMSLLERDCSIQRRHQKVVEESPSPALTPELRERMGSAAVAAAEAVGYVGAGTVEFLLDPDGESFYFLEMNTRLQVEHPVTEELLGLDLVRLQLSLELPASVTPSGHAMEVRLYAEDPASGFLPQTGTLSALDLAFDGVRVDAGVETGSVISPHYDPMIAKLIAHAPSRREASLRLARCLRQARIHGLKTNRDFLVRLLEHPSFLGGESDTGFIERHPALLEPLLDAREEAVAACAAALAGAAARRESAAVLATLPSGWRNVPSALQEVVFEGAHGAIPVSYRFSRGSLEVLRAGDVEFSSVALMSASPTSVDLSVDGVRRTYSVSFADDGTGRVWVNSPLGQADLRELDRFPSGEGDDAPGSLHSPMPGSILRVGVGVGDAVSRGQVLLVIEAMKMEHEITAPADGTVGSLPVGVGDQVEAGAVLVVIDEAEAS